MYGADMCLFVFEEIIQNDSARLVCFLYVSVPFHFFLTFAPDAVARVVWNGILAELSQDSLLVPGRSFAFMLFHL